jgi:hypothetical protein
MSVGQINGYSSDEPIVHLVTTIGNAVDCGNNWAFTDRHAELGYARYFDNLAKLVFDEPLLGTRILVSTINA